MGVIAGQLELDLVAATEADLVDRVRAAVVEPGMTEQEAEAAIADALDQLGVAPVAAAPARPCICDGGSLLLIDALAADRRCARCGREPSKP